MPVRDDVWLPSHEELTMPEIKLTSGVMRAASLYVGKYCDDICKEFMLCKLESRKDPRRCVNEGKEVTRCELDFFQKVKANCYESFTKYWQCVDRAPSMDFNRCRESQKGFDECIGKAMNVERPPVGYFSKVRIIDTNRPRPQWDDLELPPVPEVYEEKTTKTKRFWPTTGKSS